MSEHPSIRVEHLAKRFHLDRSGPADSFAGFARKTARSLGTLARPIVKNSARSTQRLASDNEFWALRDVSFEVRRGEFIGLIGRNGAGKSTLLKILSRITAPTEGRISVWGRMACLLEVGTGFSPELTGRENVFLNGAILGMTHGEVVAKFDEIVTFAEIEEFIDVPVKRYSSGMRMRLAFSVAAHLDPDILVVDEVLAVGDPPFRKKCLDKMKGAVQQGQTILLVTHALNEFKQLCDRAIWLDKGHVRAVGATAEVLAEYVETFQPHSPRPL